MTDHAPTGSFRQIVLVGAGGIGSRHLQALHTLRDCSIMAIEPNDAAADTARARYAEVATDESPALEVAPSIEKAASVVDPGAFVIVATNAEIRADVTEEAVEGLAPAALLLEKVLFQRPQDHDRIEALVSARQLPAWVNHNMALSDAWRLVRARVAGAASVQVVVAGGAWGLACNTTHYLDTFRPATSATSAATAAPWRFDTSRLDPGSVPAKRPGYRELHGTLVATCDGVDLTVIDRAGSSAPRDVLIELADERLRIEHRSSGFTVWSASDATGWRYDPIGTYPPIVQSRLTGDVVAQVAATGGCDLTPFATASPVHRAFITAITAHLRGTGETDETDGGTRCPIT